MAKVLVTAHLGRHFRIFGHYDYKVLLELGHEVHIAANFNDPIDQFEDDRVIKHQIDFARNPYSKGNIRAYKQLVKLFEKIHFELIHTQSPAGGAVTRLAAKVTRKKGTKVIYTAHGFHFFKGAPKKNWLMYYSIEKILSRITGIIITINDEDYVNALNNLNAEEVKHVHGVGIDLEKFPPQTAAKKFAMREKYNYRNEDFILIYAGELSYRKQQDLIIKSAAKLKDEIPNLKILLAGLGALEEKFKSLAKDLKVEHIVQFLGYRNDIPNLMMLSDVAISASRQEGLPVNVMEAMATGLPLVVTDCRGNRDLVVDGENGFVINLKNVREFSDAIKNIYINKEIHLKFSDNSLEMVKQYSIDKVKVEMKSIYNNELK
ncbi:glycosyltransferase family 4 protein [Psychrobacillus sp. BM2]|uniref:glycosyltransferase family 4 protein n=1 Tax=Psychrobacillus sp. BM2 TaxID=3400421 RepID=UPI003B0217B3